jgi:hypothetical protein
MVRTITPAIPAKMYRHFAVATLALTFAIAMLADGESRAAADAHSEGNVPSTPARPTNSANFDGRNGSAAQPAVVGRFSNDDGIEFGAPMDRPRGGAESSIAAVDSVQGLGYSPAYLDSLSDEEREALLASLAQSGMLSERSRKESAVQLTSASARRSGALVSED